MSFFIWSWVLALVIAPAAGTLGCFLVWKRMAFFADSLAHASLLGLAFSFVFSFNPSLGICLSGIAVCLFMWAMRENKELPSDALLSLISHVMLGIGIIVISIREIKVDLLSLLFGEWLLVNKEDLWLQGLTTIVILLALWTARSSLLAGAIQPEIAKVEMPQSRRRGVILFVALTLFVGVAIQTIGLLLLNALMIIPTLIARHWTHHPYQMIGMSIVMAALIMSGGLVLAVWQDVPASPSAAVLGGVLFALSLALRKLNSFNN